MSADRRVDIVVLIPSDGDSDGETIHKLILRGTDFVIGGDELDVMDGPRVVGRFEQYIGAFYADSLADGGDLR